MDSKSVSSEVVDLIVVKIEDFEGCRTTPDFKISVLDCIQKFTGGSNDYCKKMWSRYKKKLESDKSVTFQFQFSYYKFLDKNCKPGKPTPVAHFHAILEVLAALPGPKAKELRAHNAKVVSRAIAGDIDLIKTIEDRRYSMDPMLREVLLAGLKRSELSKLADKKAMDNFNWSVGKRTEYIKRLKALADGLLAKMNNRETELNIKLDAEATALLVVKKKLATATVSLFKQKRKWIATEAAFTARQKHFDKHTTDMEELVAEQCNDISKLKKTSAYHETNLSLVSKKLIHHNKLLTQSEKLLTQSDKLLTQSELKNKQYLVAFKTCQTAMRDLDLNLGQSTSMVKEQSHKIIFLRNYIIGQQATIVQHATQVSDYKAQTTMLINQCVSKEIANKKRKYNKLFGVKSTMSVDNMTTTFDPTLTRLQCPSLRNTMYGLMSRIACDIVCVGQTIPYKQRIAFTRKAMQSIFKVSDNQIEADVNNHRCCSNVVFTTTLIYRYVKSRLSDDAKYSTEMPVSHAYLYSNNHKAFCTQYNLFYHDEVAAIRAFYPEVHNFTLDEVDGMTAVSSNGATAHDLHNHDIRGFFL
jgi:hypothetical protein